MEKYYIGLDIGTDSVGIACADENYDVVRAKGKDLWAVRLFDEAQTSAERRTFRTARRRLARRAWRIDLLQGLFAPYMTDGLFFARLNNSGYCFEDKDGALQSPYSLFADADYTDKTFYKKYKTVFHLRRALMDGKDRADIRLYYLAIHHIVKYRGHFLFDGLKIDEIHDIKRLFAALNAAAESVFPENAIVFDPQKADDLKQIMLGAGGVREKRAKCFELFDAQTAQVKAIVALMTGADAKPAELFDNDGYSEKGKISFSKMTDEEFDALADEYGDDFEYLCAVRGIYNYLKFEKVLSGKACISDAMVALYDKHKKDLRALKRLIIGCCPHDDYVRMFKAVNECGNYASYIGYTKIGKSKRTVKKCKAVDEFYAYVKKFIDSHKQLIEQKGEEFIALRDGILSDIGEKSFMPKILNADNGLFPNQINLFELDRILSNLCRDYPEFAAADADGKTVASKIRDIFVFRIPNYVGPLNGYHADKGGNSWAKHKKQGAVTPWNFDDMIDRAESNERFMRRMTCKCSYLYGENVLPKRSIVYQQFDVLNQLNKLRVNEKPISVEVKQKIYEQLFKKHKRVTDGMIAKFLAENCLTDGDAQKIALSGKDKESDFKPSLASYVIFCDLFGSEFVDGNIELCEDIILWHTLNTDKNIVEKLVLERYGHIPQVAQNIKRIKGLSGFKEFGTLSHALLCGISGGVSPSGMPYTVLGELYNTNKNLNEILYGDEYSFAAAIDELNGGADGEVTYDTLREMRLSPSVRRGVWQAIKMTDECVRTVGRLPEKIFVEVTRGGGKKGERKQSRKEQLMQLYGCVDSIRELVEDLSRMPASELKMERLYLYFLQQGKCAYSGEPIDLQLILSDYYDVDHIMPRSVTKDDSIDNKVLVKRDLNMKKSNVYPLSQALPGVQQERAEFWKMLNRVNVNGVSFMSDKKYALLTRTEPLGEDDFRDFVARQLVVTGQSAKAVAELLKRKYGEQVKVVYSKAGNVDDFKQKYGIVKCRQTNDLHHARDAYLNIVVGNVYDTKFTSLRSSFYFKNDMWYEYNYEKLFAKPVAGAWTGESYVAHIKDVAAKTSMTVTRYAYTGKGKLFDATVYSCADGAAVPRKGSGPLAIRTADGGIKYGGYKSKKTAYFAVVLSKDKKGGDIKTIEAIPVLESELEKTKPGTVNAYLTDGLGLKEPKILVDKLKIKSLLKYNGSYVWITGTTTGRCLVANAMQWHTDRATDMYVKCLDKLVTMERDGAIGQDHLADDVFTINTNRLRTKELSVDGKGNIGLYDAIITELDKKMYGGIPAFGTVRKTLLSGREKFAALSVLEQAKVLLQCIKILGGNGGGVIDLTAIGGSKNAGLLKIGSNITKADVEIINRSECGFTEKRRKI